MYVASLLILFLSSLVLCPSGFAFLVNLQTALSCNSGNLRNATEGGHEVQSYRHFYRSIVTVPLSRLK